MFLSRFARGKTHHVTYGDTSRRLCRHIMLPKGVHHVAEGNTFAPRKSFNAFSLKQKAKEKALQKRTDSAYRNSVLEI